MKITNVYLLSLLFCVVSIQCIYADTYTPKLKSNSIIDIRKNWDLQGDTVVLPGGVTLNFVNAKVQNGILVGNKTKIIGCTHAIFDKVTISGSWNMPEISTRMFVNLSYDNSIRDVIALTDSEVYNKVYIEKGDYYFKLDNANRTGITINSNTHLTIRGNLKLKSNNLRSYDIVRVSGSDVVITGNGVIKGDLSSHIDDGGEWGMGIGIYNSTNVLVENISITECWGDCIYIGSESGNVVIDGCKLSKGRRQGLSITSAEDVKIRSSIISEIGGTSPGYAIDIEPNKSEIVGSVFISDVEIYNCHGGIFGTGKAIDSTILYVELNKCRVWGAISDYAYRFRYQQNLVMKNCLSEAPNKKIVLIQFVKNVNYNNVKVRGRLQSVRTYECGHVNI